MPQRSGKIFLLDLWTFYLVLLCNKTWISLLSLAENYHTFRVRVSNFIVFWYFYLNKRRFASLSALVTYHSALSKNLTNIKKHGKEHHSIKVGTIGGYNPLCLKSYKIRHFMISRNWISWRHTAENK